MNPWIKDKEEKYLRGWDRRATIVLVGTSVLLTLYSFLGRRRFFTQHFGKFFIQHPLRRIFPYFYWFWMSAITLLLLPVLVVKLGIKDKIRDYGFRMTHGKLGWGFVLVGWLLMLPLIALVLQFFPSFQQKYPLSSVAGTSWKVFLVYEISYGVYMFCWEFFFSLASCFSGWRNGLAIIAFLFKPSRSCPSTPPSPFQKRWGQSLRALCLAHLLWKRGLLSTARQSTGLSLCRWMFSHSRGNETKR